MSDNPLPVYIFLEKEKFDHLCQNIEAIKESFQHQGIMHVPKRWLVTAEVAELLNIKVRTVFHYISKDLLHPRKVGGLNLFDREEIEKLIQNKL